MKITLEPYSGGVYTSHTDAEHIDEIVDMFKGLLVSAGYHPCTVDSIFNETASGSWNLAPEEPEQTIADDLNFE